MYRVFMFFCHLLLGGFLVFLVGSCAGISSTQENPASSESERSKEHPGTSIAPELHRQSEPAVLEGTGESVERDGGGREREREREANPPEPSGFIPDACFQSPDFYKRIQCISPYIAAIVKQDSAKQAMCRLLGLLKDGKIQECHLLAHVIGEATLEKYQGDPGKALQQCPMDCIQGCIHGVMESYVGSLRKQGNVSVDTLLSICDKLSQEPLTHAQCIHGLGHGLLAHGFLSLTDAIAACQRSKDENFVTTCLSGVFMENFDRYSLVDEATLKRLLPGLCESVKTRSGLLALCVASVGEGLMFYTGYQLAKSHELCDVLASSYDNQTVQACKEAARVEGANRKESQRSVSVCGP